MLMPHVSPSLVGDLWDLPMVTLVLISVFTLARLLVCMLTGQGLADPDTRIWPGL